MEASASPSFDVPDQLPARMLNEYAYCPRLFYLEYVQGEWAHSADTLEGRFVHRRVDQVAGSAPAAEALTDETRIHARSVQVGSLELGAIAVVDLLEGDGLDVTPVDYKRGSPPPIPERAWEPERVQVCLQGLLLRENGYTCPQAVLYFAEAKTRVEVPFTEELVERTRSLLVEARATARGGRIPPPLVDSPKCLRCSLAGICLPDEINLLRHAAHGPMAAEGAGEVGEWPEGGASSLPDGAVGHLLDGVTTARFPDDEASSLADGAVGSLLEGVTAAGFPDDEASSLSPEGKGGLEVAVTIEVPGGAAGSPARAEPRRLLPARDDRIPLYVQGQGYSIGLSGEVLEVREKGRKVDEVRLIDLSQVSLFGNVQLTAQALRELVSRDIPVLHLSYGGWLTAVTTPPPHKNIELRRKQFEAAADPARALAIARALVTGKVRNCRTMLRRNARPVPEEVLRGLTGARRDCARADGLASLLGIEGNAARHYFSALPAMLKPPGDLEGEVFDFQGRNRRPPRDPVNALLSFVYAMLTKDLVATVVGVGFDPYLGFYHQPRYGRPALALDLMEEFRPLVGDSVVLGLINNGEVQAADFVRRAGACALTATGRKRVLEAYERRMDQLVTHPLFGYSLSYRRVLEVQARLLARHLCGEIETYPPFCTR